MTRRLAGLPSRTSFTVHIFLLTFALSAILCSTSSTASNDTTTPLDEENDEETLLSETDLEEFKERYRRLIPYMTFYVANNYVNGQTAPARNYLNGAASSSLPRRPQQSPTRQGIGPTNVENVYRVSLPNVEKKFVPSVQYDPRNIGGDNDFFSPVNYGAKLSYSEQHSIPYRLHQGQEPTYAAITTPSARFPPENRYYTTVRPARPYGTTQLRDYLPRKQTARPIQASLPPADYILDYTSRPTKINPAVNYQLEDYKGQAYIQHVSQKEAPVAEPPNGGHPNTITTGHRKPNVNLNHLLESFRLSERLPEVLNNANLDSSVRTLAEILSILHGTGREDFPPQRVPFHPFQPFPPPLPLPPLKIPSKLSGFEDFKVRYTRPKVITESRFQATPRPAFLTDDPERFASDAATAVQNEKPKAQLQSDYNGLGDEKIIDYYPPYVQDDVHEEDKQAFKPTPVPQNHDIPTGHSYEITEDLSDDILEDERLTSPMTTVTPIIQQSAPDETSSQKPILPQVSLKYGATRGKPNVDYPAHASIPETNFSCKEQRYKGFFGDPATGCQVWHYCDLNGGKSSFLCPNGTIFSQVALTCDWWFNVKCESTTQLYVLNERLYKYILPIMPKFPEDFTGPEVDRYLEIKFKEMEAKLKEKKLKKQQEGKGKVKDKLQTLANNENVK